MSDAPAPFRPFQAPGALTPRGGGLTPHRREAVLASYRELARLLGAALCLDASDA